MTATVPPDSDLLRALCASTTDFILVIDNDGYCHKVLASQARFGKPERMLGKTIRELLNADLADQLVATVREALRTAQPQTVRYSVDFAELVAWYQATVTPLSDSLALWVARDITEQQSLKQAQARLQTFEALADRAIDGIAIAGEDTIITYANTAYCTLTGVGDKIVGTSFMDTIVPEQHALVFAEALPTLMRDGVWQGVLTEQRLDGCFWENQLSAFLLPSGENQPQLMAAIVRDISEQRRLDGERAELQEQVIEAQQAALRELSTPLVPIAAGVIAMPLVGAIDSRRAQQVMETLLEGIMTQQASYAIIDITGVRIVDTQVASVLLRVAQATQLLGARVILTGISPEVAQTLVQLGADLSGIVVRSTVQSGITYALSA